MGKTCSAKKAREAGSFAKTAMGKAAEKRPSASLKKSQDKRPKKG